MREMGEMREMRETKVTTVGDAEALVERVRERYAGAARRARAQAVAQTGAASCCDTGCCATAPGDEMSVGLYGEAELAELPEGAALASLGCGNPTALIALREGETVLDLGSGAGLDALLSARRVGPTGFVYGLDMTDEMLALAQEHRAQAGATNVAFLRGRIEEIPLPAQAVDVVISNCVINLAADKGQVLREAFRVLKPGGRFAVADVVAEGTLPAALRSSMEAWVGCLAGALEVGAYEEALRAAGFEEVRVTITKRYTAAEAGIDTTTLPMGWEASDGRLASAFVRASRPVMAEGFDLAQDPEADLPVASVSGGCCGGDCCA